MFKKSWPILYSKLLNKMGQDFQPGIVVGVFFSLLHIVLANPIPPPLHATTYKYQVKGIYIEYYLYSFKLGEQFDELSADGRQVLKKCLIKRN